MHVICKQSAYRAAAFSVEIENEAEASLYPRECPRRHSAHAFLEVVTVERHQLGDVRNGVPRESHRLGAEKYVTGCVEQGPVGGDDDSDHRPETTAVERVGLHDQDGMTKARLRPARLRQVGPPDFASKYYQSDFPMLRAWARRISGDKPLGCSA